MNPDGLPPRVYQHGRRFRMRIHVDGRPGWHYFAAKNIDDFWLEYARLSGETSARHTIAHGIRRYMDRTVPELLRAGNMSWATWRTERLRCEKLIQIWGHMLPDQVRKSHLYDAMEAGNGQEGMRLLKRLSAIWSWMLRWEMVSGNPFNGLEWPRMPARDRYVTDDEIRLARMIALDRAFHCAPSAIIVWAALWAIELTGRRVSDVRKIQLQQLIEEGIRFKEGKTKKWIVVRWTDELREMVREIIRMCHGAADISPMFLICNTRGYECSEGSLNQAMQRLRPWFDLAGITPFQLRDLRAKYATDLDAQGEDAARNLQHSSTAITRKHYLRRGAVVRPLR